MFVKAIKIVKKAMFPIFRLEKLQQDQAKIGVAGSGFFINSEGVFVTVAHIFDSKNQNTTFKYWGSLPEKITNPPKDIIEITRDDNHDVFIGKVKIKNHGFLHLHEKIPDVGRSVSISGYPLANITQNRKGGLNLGGVRKYFQPTFVLDKAKLRSGGTGKNRIHIGFLVRDFGLFGMSGGPVFDINGDVMGIQASVTNPRESKSADGRKISVENACVIKSSLILDLLKKHHIKNPE